MGEYRRPIAICAAALAAAGFGAWFATERMLAEADRVIRQDRSFYSVEMMTAGDQGRTLFSGDLDGERVRYQQARIGEISKNVQNAVLAIEDHRYYSHAGIDWIRTARAAMDGLTSISMPRGTSTITQQLARNVYDLDRTKSWKRKVREAFLAMQLERRLGKDEILERYLNIVPLGHDNSYDVAGVALASRVYVGKPVADLTIAEAALLAGMIQAPSRLDPRSHPRQARARRNVVLRAMRRAGYITEAERVTASGEELPSPGQLETPGDYFIDAARRELTAAHANYESMKVQTTLDARLQGKVEAIAEVWGARLEKRFRGAEKPELAIVAMDPRTGAIRALAGGRSFRKSQLNRAFSKRAPGSTFKPLVYAAAMEQSLARGDARYAPDTIVEDEPVEMFWDGQAYTPGNYHGGYEGPIPMRRALSRSSNAVAVRVASDIGYRTVANLARRAGLESTDATPSAALGTYEVSPVELAGAFAVFANGGYAVDPHTTERILSPEGVLLQTPADGPRRILDARAAYLTTDMLRSVILEGTAAGARRMGLKIPAAGKTGTTRDSWFAGFTTELVCVVWVGFDDHRDLGIEGAKGALPIWVDVMNAAARMKPYSGRRSSPSRRAWMTTWSGRRCGRPNWWRRRLRRARR